MKLSSHRSNSLSVCFDFIVRFGLLFILQIIFIGGKRCPRRRQRRDRDRFKSQVHYSDKNVHRRQKKDGKKEIKRERTAVSGKERC